MGRDDSACCAKRDDFQAEEAVVNELPSGVAPRRTAREGQAQSASDAEQRLATLAHDLNNLLTPILALSSSLEMEASSHGDNADQVLALRLASERAVDFVQRALRSLGPESVFQMDTAVSEILPVLRAIAGEGVELRVEQAVESGLVRLERSRLESVLLNLVRNARDAISASGRITLRTARVSVDARRAKRLGVRPGHYAELQVVDTGSGIHDAVLERIFFPHFTTKPPGKGSGLGLAHVKRFVDDCGGAILVQTRVGKGTTFTLLFPELSAEAPRHGDAWFSANRG